VSPPKASSSLLLPSVGTKFKSFSGDHETVKKVEEKKCEEEKKIIKISSPACSVMKSEVNEKVVIDIASCDGPVRFKRVLNDAFERKKQPTVAPEAQQMPSEMKFHNAVSFHEQMVRNINEQYKKGFSTASNEESENSQHSIDLYTCVYCNHTFKSKYCYQKHAKRHINPLNPLGRCRMDVECESSDGEHKKQQSQQNLKRDSIKPLDMNVQYYPCKYCGCKFPSYYFVHKHRKLCHPEVEAEGGSSMLNISQEEPKEENSKSDTKSENS
jgi:hypothetical protein